MTFAPAGEKGWGKVNRDLAAWWEVYVIIVFMDKKILDVLEEMSTHYGMVAEIEAELDCIASSIAFNLSVKCSLERFEKLLEDGS